MTRRRSLYRRSSTLIHLHLLTAPLGGGEMVLNCWWKGCVMRLVTSSGRLIVVLILTAMATLMRTERERKHGERATRGCGRSALLLVTRW
ncbi:hypothetical protein M3J09_008745 [Ascochyta lentis]